MNSRYITVGNTPQGEEVSLAYEDYGSGKPVVMMHGWPLSKEMWEYQVCALVEAGHRVITYDRRGFGASSRPWNGYDYDTLTSDLHEIIQQLNLKEVTLVAFSMAGGEAVRYFTRYGGKDVRKVALISSVTPFLMKTADNPEGVPQDIFDKMLEDMKADRIAFLDGFGKAFFGVHIMSKPVSVPLLEYYRSLASSASPHATMECMKAFSQTDFRKEMSGVNVPVLIIHGSSDKTVPIDPTGIQNEKLIPDNRMIIYEGAPHGLWYTEQERLNADLLEFLG